MTNSNKEQVLPSGGGTATQDRSTGQGQDKVLQVENLHVEFVHEGVVNNAVTDVSFRVDRGSTLGIVGESGSGKSVSSLAIMGLLPQPPACRVTGNIKLFPRGQAEPVAQIVPGRHVSMIFQEPMTSLNPVHKCGAQVVEMLLAHEQVDRAEARRRAIELFEEVLLPRPDKIFDSYPHELSGGQRQRVMIAMALICHPDILIADEPTTALDVTVQKAILELLRTLQDKYRMGIIFITHDLGVIAQIADHVAVMYKGAIVEQGTASQVLHHPQHPYTQGLLACRPPMDSRPRRLPTVQDYLGGTVPTPLSLPEQPPRSDDPTPLLRVRDLSVTYPLKKNILGHPTQVLNAVDGLSFEIHKGETVGLVGESGCGKSTLGRAILQLTPLSGGTVEYEGTRLDHLSPRDRTALRRKIQIVFQDPYSSLNPRITVGDAILEPLRCHRLLPDDTHRRRRARQLMEQVGLPPDWYNRYPHQLSGGQRQRVCIARALALQPQLVICDESVSALDVSVQAQVLNLLADLKEQFGYTYLFITHNLAVVKYFSDRILVMQQGRIVEQGTSTELFSNPRHPYTRRLLAAIPKV